MNSSMVKFKLLAVGVVVRVGKQQQQQQQRKAARKRKKATEQGWSGRS